ncbi:uncharacterized protein FOMMEDRAFT_161161 [Fomitiporia mediterranea MF3/22]|uniref:uncharacterized protein n=1 Tax=Fomitiporia mediterranea (strain MF3/22) TaxID=694068 RepID=UPI000440838F|nr:uncharacterized protein FOMMEDRAFT_161161 [Fomitiporia mediterranea MF3/22]EJC98951.1 hypothetical protein FOMMEDRAFT_161161 [Fomitiporia mediterranea MF3/22]
MKNHGFLLTTVTPVERPERCSLPDKKLLRFTPQEENIEGDLVVDRQKQRAILSCVYTALFTRKNLFQGHVDRRLRNEAKERRSPIYEKLATLCLVRIEAVKDGIVNQSVKRMPTRAPHEPRKIVQGSGDLRRRGTLYRQLSVRQNPRLTSVP